MNTIEVKVSVQLDFSEETKSFIAALLNTHSPVNCCGITGWSADSEEASMPEMPIAPKNPEPEPVKPAEAPAPAAKESITIEDVRKALQEKVNKHRETIKEKLTELGSPNVTKLDPEKYEEMFNFLKDLD